MLIENTLLIKGRAKCTLSCAAIPIVILVVCGCNDIPNKRKYYSAEAIQVSWSMISERPVDAREILPYFKLPSMVPYFPYFMHPSLSDYATKLPIGDPDKIIKVIDSIASQNDIIPYDLRMVCLFVKDKGVDTLVIDQEGHAQFGAKRFRIDGRLATMLHIKSVALNPDYHPQVGKWEYKGKNNW